jgi:hypothetical protein
VLLSVVRVTRRHALVARAAGWAIAFSHSISLSSRELILGLFLGADELIGGLAPLTEGRP